MHSHRLKAGPGPVTCISWAHDPCQPCPQLPRPEVAARQWPAFSCTAASPHDVLALGADGSNCEGEQEKKKSTTRASSSSRHDVLQHWLQLPDPKPGEKLELRPDPKPGEKPDLKPGQGEVVALRALVTKSQGLSNRTQEETLGVPQR